MAMKLNKFFILFFSFLPFFYAKNISANPDLVLQNTNSSFGLVFLNQNCQTQTEKSFISWKFPVVLKNTGPHNQVGSLDRIEVRAQKRDSQKAEITITGYVHSEIYLIVKFIGLTQLAQDLISYTQIKSKANQVFLVTEFENCLDRHVYKVENYSILNPWRQQ